MVDDPAIVGIERFGLQGTTAVAHGLGEVLDLLNKRVVAHVAVVFDVHDHAGRGGIVGEQNAVHEELHILERLVVTANQ
jgi:hypothetical protein